MSQNACRDNIVQDSTDFMAYDMAQRQDDFMKYQTDILHRDIIQLDCQEQFRFNELIRKIDCVGKKPRKRKVNQSMAVNDQGEILLITTYSDGSKKACQFMLNVFGGWKVYRLKFDRAEGVSERFGIFFGNFSVCIIEELKRNKPANLYEAFVKAGVNFNTEISRQTIATVLFQQFASEIDNCQNVWNFQALAGWNGKKFFHADSLYFFKKREFQNLPIVRKTFIFQQDEEAKKEYLESLKDVPYWRCRLLFLAYPCVGMLASIFSEFEIEKTPCLNFMLSDGYGKDVLVNLLQVFNRGKNETIMADANDKNLGKQMLEVNDKVMFIDAFIADENSYKRDKIKKNVDRIRREFFALSISDFNIGWEINAALVFFSDYRMVGKNVYNIAIKEELFGEMKNMQRVQKRDVVGAIFSEFICFVEKNYDTVISIIQSSSVTEGALPIAFSIVEFFWSNEGVNLRETLDLPQQINFLELFSEDFECDEAKEAFVEAVRREASQMCMIEKRRNAKMHEACYYSNEYFLMPPAIVKSVAERNGLATYLAEILSELKISGELQTSGEGFSKRFQTGGETCEMYWFHRSLFSPLGSVDIIDLGKRLDEND